MRCVQQCLSKHSAQTKLVDIMYFLCFHDPLCVTASLSFPQFFFFVSCHCASLLPPTLLYPPLPFTCQELSGVYGGVVKRQTEFVALCIDHILSLYWKLNLTTSSVPILAHSMVGGGERRGRDEMPECKV